jgi:hypothetical protein
MVMSIPNQDIGVGRQGMLSQDPLEIVNTPTQQPQNINWQTLEQSRLSGNPFAIDPTLAENIRKDRELTRRDKGFLFGMGEDKFQDERQNQGFIGTALGSQVRASDSGRFKAFQDTQTAQVLRNAGLQPVYEQDQYRGYQYNPATGQYDYYDHSPSKFEQIAPELIKAGIMSVATGGLGGAIGAATGLGAGVSTGLATGAITLAQGGDVKDAVINGFTAGLGAHTKQLNDAIKAGNATKEIVAQAEMFNNIKNVTNIAQAIESGNTLGAIIPAMDLAGMPSVNQVVGENLAENFSDNTFVMENLDPLTKAITKGVEVGVTGGNNAQLIAKTLWEYASEGGKLPIDLDTSVSWDTPEWMKQIDDSILQPTKDAIVSGYQALNENVLNPMQETVDGMVRALPTTKEDWEAAEDFVKEDVSPTVRDAGRGARDLLGGVVGAVAPMFAGGQQQQMVAGTQQAKEPEVDYTSIILSPTELTKPSVFDYEGIERTI